MGKIADIIKKFLNEFINKSLKDDMELFKKPKALVALQIAALAILNPLLKRLKSSLEEKISKVSDKSKLISSISDTKNITDDDVERYVKNNRDLQRLLNFASNDLNESIISDIVLACGNPDYYSNQADDLNGMLSNMNINGDDLIGVAQSQSDFDEKVDSYNLNGLNHLLNKVNGTLPWIFAVYVIILKVKEFLTQSDHPSPYRGKYIQRLIRIMGAILKQELNATKNIPNETKEGTDQIKSQITEMIDALKSLDAIIVGALMATFIYIGNRKAYQDKSLEVFSQNTLSCDSIERPRSNEETRVVSAPFDITLNCPIDIEEPFVPHEPFELKNDIKRLESCEPVLNPVNELGDQTANDIATKALFENKSSKDFNILVKQNQRVNSRTLLGTLGGDGVYSPVDGIITNISKNQIYIGDVKDPENPYLEELIQKTQDLYKELNDIKFFLKDLYVDSWYPVMLKESPLIDASLSNQEIKNILYLTGGVERRFKIATDSQKTSQSIYDKNVQKIAGKDNVEKKAKTEQLTLIKEEIDKEDQVYYDSLRNITDIAIQQAQVTLPKDEEFTLIEYYFTLYQSVLSFWDQNEITIPFRDKLNEIITERYFIDEWNLLKLESRINTLCTELSKDTFFQTTRNFFKKMTDIYNEKKNIDDVNSYVKSLGDKNKTFTEDEKTKAADKIMFLFNFFLSIVVKGQANYETKVTKYEATVSEANFIENYFGQLWKRYDEIPKELEDIMKKLDDLGNTLTTYSIVTIDEEQYRYYGIGKERPCPIPKEEGDDYLSPFSDFEYKDINYWLKYCAIATLISVVNVPSWSTGFPPPVGPIPFPVVYIPIKAFQLNWGFIVIGITITGIYPFPWVLFGNLSTGYHVPVADPATIIKKNIDALKKALTSQLKAFKKEALQNYLNETKSKIQNINNEIDNLEDRKRQLRTEKPKKDKSQKNYEVIYAKELLKWNETFASISEQLVSKRTARFALETKYKIVYDASKGSKVKDVDDPKIKSIQKSEEQIDKQFTKLNQLVDSIDPMLAPLPIATKPASASFAFTIKNPKPIIKFSDDLNDNVNNGVLNPLVNKFKIKNEDLMSSNFGSKMDNSVLNTKKYKGALKAAMPTIIQKDAFPKYQNLKMTNVPYILFLTKDWTPTGGKTYGIPSFPPLPIG